MAEVRFQQESSSATPFASTWKYTVDTTPAAMIRIAIGNLESIFAYSYNK